jgi:hypothetical protein
MSLLREHKDSLTANTILQKFMKMAYIVQDWNIEVAEGKVQEMMN